MNTHLRFVVLLSLPIFLLCHTSCTAQNSNKISTDQKALAALVQELDSAYNVQDAVRFSAVFAEDADFQFSVEGLVLHGRDEIKRHFAKQFATLPPMRHVTTTGKTDAITPGILAVDIQVDIFAVDPKTGLAQTLLVHYNGLGLGIHTDLGWHIRLVRLYRMVK
jgi:uncharacterized protein (TIGR02246 family)